MVYPPTNQSRLRRVPRDQEIVRGSKEDRWFQRWVTLESWTSSSVERLRWRSSNDRSQAASKPSHSLLIWGGVRPCSKRGRNSSESEWRRTAKGLLMSILDRCRGRCQDQRSGSRLARKGSSWFRCMSRKSSKRWICRANGSRNRESVLWMMRISWKTWSRSVDSRSWSRQITKSG